MFFKQASMLQLAEAERRSSILIHRAVQCLEMIFKAVMAFLTKCNMFYMNSKALYHVSLASKIQGTTCRPK